MAGLRVGLVGAALAGWFGAKAHHTLLACLGEAGDLGGEVELGGGEGL